MNLWVFAALLVTGKGVLQITHFAVCISQYPEQGKLRFGIFSIPKEPSVILTPVIHYVLGPEQGPSVDCLSTSPKAALGNE